MDRKVKKIKEKYSRLKTVKYKHTKLYRRNCRKCGKPCCGKLCLSCYYSKSGRGAISRRGRYERYRERDIKRSLERYYKRKKKDGNV